MKTLKKITLICLLATIIGCSKDDSSGEEISFAELKGTWEVTHYNYEGTTTYRSINTNEGWNTSYHGEAWLLNFDMIIGENPNDYNVAGNYKIDFYYTDENGEEFYYVGTQTKDESGTYVRNSNSNVSFHVDDIVKNGNILQLDDSTLEIIISSSSSETTDDNIVETRIRKETYIYKRVD